MAWVVVVCFSLLMAACAYAPIWKERDRRKAEGFPPDSGVGE